MGRSSSQRALREIHNDLREYEKLFSAHPQGKPEYGGTQIGGLVWRKCEHQRIRRGAHQ
jgi:hypothetical protein